MLKLKTETEIAAFFDKCDEFGKYRDVKEYTEDILTILVYSSWHYSEEQARNLVDESEQFIKESFQNKVPAADCAVDVGYSCG